MSLVYHERPGVYSSYDASSIIARGSTERVIALIGKAEAKAGLYRLHSYAEAKEAFAEGSELGRMAKLAYQNGAGTVLASPVAEDTLEAYQAALALVFAEKEAGFCVVGSALETVQKALRDAVGIVLQKNVLFSGTVRENLRWGNPDASDETLWAACRAACADEFLQRMPKGLDTDLGQGGVNVSGGQKQRLCIARTLLKNPKILIFDDSTSAVDTATEAKIRAELAKLQEVTKIIIAQRVTSVMDSDQIVIMENGRIHAVGTHDELLAGDPIYQEIYHSQMKGGQLHGQTA